jgi:hypothetical protein
MARFQQIWLESGPSKSNDSGRTLPNSYANCQVMAPLSDAGDGRWNLASATGFQQLDTKIQGLSAVDSSYQQTLMPDYSGFSQTCVQE